MFAKAHIIEDTHAMRTLDTRLGASFMFALLVVIIALFVFVFGEPNILTITSLVPAPRNSSSMKINGYGQLNVTVRMIAPRNDDSDTCDKIIEQTASRSLGCESSTIQGDAGTKAKAESTGTMFCTMDFNCSTTANLRGTQEIKIGLPDAFQLIEWTVWNEQYDMAQPPMTTHHVLGVTNNNRIDNTKKETTPSLSNQVLAGSDTNPTTLNFGVIRSIVNDTRFEVEGGCITSGLRLTWRDVARVQSIQGTETGKHYVAFRFAVDETLFSKILDLKLKPANQLSVVITYCLTVIALMTTLKSVLQMVIDRVYLHLAQKNKTEAPEDVQRRQRVLDEHAITRLPGQQGRRRLSSKNPLFDSIGGNRGGIRGESDGIEMTNLAFSNPMPRKTPTHRKRRSSAPSAFANPPPAPVSRGAHSMSLELEQRMTLMENEMNHMLDIIAQQSEMLKVRNLSPEVDVQPPLPPRPVRSKKQSFKRIEGEPKDGEIV